MESDHEHMRHEDQSGRGSSGWSRDKIVLVGFLVVAGFYLFTEHRAHLYGALPWLLLALCPLMHLFMHGGGHGGHGGHGDSKSAAPPDRNKGEGSP